MRAVIQRSLQARVSVEGKCVGEIQRGIVALIGINEGDSKAEFDYILDKMINLRIFEDENDKMNLSVNDLELGLLLVPNFTIYGDARKGRRPSFSFGASPSEAEGIWQEFIAYAKEKYSKIETGIFRADMKVEILNDGPVTILLDSDRLF